MTRRYYISDVFHEGPYSGNQLATVIDTDNLSSEEMQQIARQFNLSETTFYLGGDQNHGYDVRIFTVKEEVPFAGHPSLGSAYLIKHHIEHLDTPHLTLNLGVGKIPISFEDNGLVWMKQPSPKFSDIYSIQETARMLNLPIEDIDAEFPAQCVSTGLNFFMVPLKSLDALKRATITESPALGTFMFSRESYSNDYAIAARMLMPENGITEDPATGSANGCLASYLLEHQYFGSETLDIKVAQGYEINRPSSLYLKASKINGNFDINVGGHVRLAAKGELV